MHIRGCGVCVMHTVDMSEHSLHAFANARLCDALCDAQTWVWRGFTNENQLGFIRGWYVQGTMVMQSRRWCGGVALMYVTTARCTSS